MQRVILTPRELVLPEARTLDASLLNAYKEGINSYTGKARKALDIFSDRDGELAGSNCFAPIELRKYLSDLRLATMVDLGRATEINSNFLKGFYSDTGLVLRTAGDSYKDNDFLSRDLAEQLKKRNIDLEFPKVIYFDALDLRQDENSSYGLAYVLNEGAELGKNIFDAPELMHDYNFKTMNEKTGIPIEDPTGNRTNYTRQEGLDRFYLGRYSDVDSNNRYLAYSGANGRVVGVGNFSAK